MKAVVPDGLTRDQTIEAIRRIATWAPMIRAAHNAAKNNRRWTDTVKEVKAARWEGGGSLHGDVWPDRSWWFDSTNDGSQISYSGPNGRVVAAVVTWPTIAAVLVTGVTRVPDQVQTMYDAWTDYAEASKNDARDTEQWNWYCETSNRMHAAETAVLDAGMEALPHPAPQDTQDSLF